MIPLYHQQINLKNKKSILKEKRVPTGKHNYPFKWTKKEASRTLEIGVNILKRKRRKWNSPLASPNNKSLGSLTDQP